MIGARALAALAAPIIAAATVSQGWLSTQEMMRAGASLADGVWRYLGYFTVLTNLFVVLVLARAALKPTDRAGLNAPAVELMAVTSILFVGVVYNLLLASQWDPQGLRKVNDVILHDASPLAFAAFWLMRPRGGVGWRDGAFAALWPMAYSAYSLARGALDGFYPYFFMNPATTPWPLVLLNDGPRPCLHPDGAAVGRRRRRRRAARRAAAAPPGMRREGAASCWPAGWTKGASHPKGVHTRVFSCGGRAHSPRKGKAVSFFKLPARILASW